MRKTLQRSSTVKTQRTKQSSRVQSQVNAIHLVCSTGAIVSTPHLHSVKNCPENSGPIKYGDWNHSVMIAIVYTYKLSRKKLFMAQTRLVIAQTGTFVLLPITIYTYIYVPFQIHMYFKDCSRRANVRIYIRKC